VQEDDGLTGATSSGGVVVEPSAGEIDELTAHDFGGAGGGMRCRLTRPCAKMPSPHIRDKRGQMHRGLTT